MTRRSGSWSTAGSTIVQLWDSHGSYEVGPAVLRPDGTVFATGANGVGAGHTSIYNLSTGTWTPGPDFPGNLDIADGPAALLPDGNVLMAASPGIFLNGVEFFEWDGHNLNPVPATPDSPFDSSWYGRMLVLPTGQVLYTDGSTDVEVYTPAGQPVSWHCAVCDFDFGRYLTRHDPPACGLPVQWRLANQCVWR